MHIFFRVGPFLGLNQKEKETKNILFLARCNSNNCATVQKKKTNKMISVPSKDSDQVGHLFYNWPMGPKDSLDLN